MKRRKKLETDARPIGDRPLTLREAADVAPQRAHHAECLQRGEIEGRIIGWITRHMTPFSSRFAS